jgi:hypothetical protein
VRPRLRGVALLARCLRTNAYSLRGPKNRPFPLITPSRRPYATAWDSLAPSAIGGVRAYEVPTILATSDDTSSLGLRASGSVARSTPFRQIRKFGRAFLKWRLLVQPCYRRRADRVYTRFIRDGGRGLKYELAGRARQARRQAFILTGNAAGAHSTYATHHPGIYAVGDDRSGSTKRRASSVGEGSVVISEVWKFLHREICS